MARYVCPICGYIHDESATGESFSSLSDSWTCPVCGAAKSEFEAEPEKEVTAEPVTPAEQADSAVQPVAASAPGVKYRALQVHRVCGYIFLALYVWLLVQMVPRLWTYQIEFPARTVVHIALGMAIGVMLVLKISVVRFFRRLDQALVPLLGTSLLVCSVVLIGISVPAAFREALITATLFTEENRERVRALLAQTGLEESECIRLASAESLRSGQQILRQECVDCHDLRTALAKPRTPALWRQTVARMADRAAAFNPLDDEDQWQVTAYLTALSPQLQKSARQLNEQQQRRDASLKAAEAVATQDGPVGDYDEAAAQALFQAKCSQCHDVSLVTASPPVSEAAARALVAAMVEEGLDASQDELALIVEYLTNTYAKQ